MDTTEFGAPPDTAELDGFVETKVPESLNAAGPEAEPESGEPDEFSGKAYVTEVDGEPAQIRPALSGLSGGPLLEDQAVTTDASVLQRIAQCREREALLHSVAKKAVTAFKEAKAETEAAVSVAAEHYSASRGEQMTLAVPREGGEPE
jgi:hypothetical protein